MFSVYVLADGELETDQEQDGTYESRGNFAQEETQITLKRLKLLIVQLEEMVDVRWMLGSDLASFLRDLKHDVPVELFGGFDVFAVMGYCV